MTKLRIMSDLHLEFGKLDLEPAGEDVLVLAGDIGLHTDGALWARRYAFYTGIPVVMAAGNHEFYRGGEHRDHTVNSTLTALRRIGDGAFLTFLEDDAATVAGVSFVGCTLWTDYALNGDPIRGALLAARGMKDHRLIRENNGAFTPADAARRHAFSVGVLRERLPRRYVDGPLVVMTHHLPSRRSCDPRFDGALDPAYASNLDELVAGSDAALWVHGHTHVSQDYQIGETRVLCNPRGYHPDALNPAFDPGLIVEV